MPNHRVTVGLYSVQMGQNFNPAALSQISNLVKIQNHLSRAARIRSDTPPEMVLSVLLIPDWRSGSSYLHDDYSVARNGFLMQLREQLNQAGLQSVILQNFYDVASDEEKGYLEHLQSRGSNADMIKTHALISEDNVERRHLQMDSNTIIHDYQGLYDATFGRDDSAGVNASYYDMDYVSIHNKIVYAPPHNEFIRNLREVHLAYCSEHKDDHLFESTQREKISKNSIYARDFTVAAHRSGLTTKISIPLAGGEYRTIYPAVMGRPEYGLSRFLVTAVNMSWSETPATYAGAIAKLPLVQVGDAECDFACFKMAVKKYIGSLHYHKYGGKPDLLTHDLSIVDAIAKNAAIKDDREARQELLACSNVDVDKAIIAKFYDSAVASIIADSDMHFTIEILAEEFLDITRGNVLTQEIFGCTVRELHDSPVRYTQYRDAHLSQKESFVESLNPNAIEMQRSFKMQLQAMKTSAQSASFIDEEKPDDAPDLSSESGHSLRPGF